MNLRQWFGRVVIQLRGANVAGWEMSASAARSYFKGLGKTVVTYFGYSSIYEDEQALFEIARKTLSGYSPEKYLINIGVTRSGLGAIYPIAKSMGFTTAGIVSTLALEYPDGISKDVDHICFIKDTQWGGKLPNSETLCPTSLAMVTCSDILIGIGGNEVARDELLYGRALGKPIQFFPAEMNHVWWTQRRQRQGLPPPESFWGAAHEVFARKNDK